jgi:hypothetical protein
MVPARSTIVAIRIPATFFIRLSFRMQAGLLWVC